MKKLTPLFLLSLMLVFTFTISAQTGFSDNFNDSIFAFNPLWVGEVSRFGVNITKELQLNNAGAASNNET